jgi:hypothetical protein
MTDGQKATRQIIKIGNLEVEGFMLPDGSYRMSQTQAAESIGEEEVYARNFLTAKGVKQLLGLSYTPETFEIEATEQARGQTRIQGWTLEMIYTYWVYRCSKGNKAAFVAVIALGTESLERRFDDAFGVTRTEADYNQRLIMRTQELEAALQQIGDGLAFDDDLRMERDRFRQLLDENGIDPYGLSDQA